MKYLLVLLLLLASCTGDRIAENLFPSSGIYEQGELTLMTDAQDQLMIIYDDTMLFFQVSGSEDAPVRMMIRFSSFADSIQISGYDPRGLYSSFVLAGEVEELFERNDQGQVFIHIPLDKREAD